MSRSCRRAGDTPQRGELERNAKAGKCAHTATPRKPSRGPNRVKETHSCKLLPCCTTIHASPRASHTVASCKGVAALGSHYLTTTLVQTVFSRHAMWRQGTPPPAGLGSAAPSRWPVRKLVAYLAARGAVVPHGTRSVQACEARSMFGPCQGPRRLQSGPPGQAVRLARRRLWRPRVTVRAVTRVNRSGVPPRRDPSVGGAAHSGIR